MNQETADYGDGPYHFDIPGLTGAGDTYEEQGRWGGLTPEAAMLAANPPLEVDKAPITADVRTYVSQAAGLELGCK